MTLAAINFAFPFMLLVGLLAATIPILLHLLNRIRSPIVPFSTLRFLRITAQKTSRRRQLQQWLLLLLRMAVFAMLGMAVAGPVIGGGNLALAYGMILLLLVGVGLLAMTGVLITTAMDQTKAKGGPASSEEMVAQTRAHTAEDKAKAISKPQPGKYWGLSAATLLLAVLLGGYAAFGLGSNTYFTHGGGEFSGRSTACVIILDNSHSMLARQDSMSRIQRAKEQVRQLLVDVLKPAEMAVLLTNPVAGAPTPSLTAESTSVLGSLEKLAVAGRALPMKDRIQSAVAMLSESPQPNRMLILISDYAGPVFGDVEMFSALAGVKNLQVVLMPQGSGSLADMGITRFTVAGGQPVIGTEIVFEADLVNNSDANEMAEAEFLVDDQPVPTIAPRTPVGTGRQGRATIKIPYRLAAAGLHKYTLKLKDDSGALAWDNTRDLVLNVSQQVKVLVVGPEEKPRFKSAAYYATAALAPYEGLRAPGGEQAMWSIAPTYANLARVDAASFRAFAAVFICDVPQIPGPIADGLKRYAEAGGRVILQMGPGVDVKAYNAELGKRDLLPGLLTQSIVTAEGSPVDYVDTSTEVFANLYDTNEPFQRVVVTGRWGLAGNRLEHGRALWKLADGSPLIVRQPVGTGDVYTMLTVPSADWSNFSTQPAFLAAMNRMAQGELGNLRRETSYETGQVLLIPANTDNGKLRLQVTTPEKKTFSVEPISGGAGEPARWAFGQTQQAGIYTWESSDGPPASVKGMFAVNPPADEAELASADVEKLAATIKTDEPAVVARTPAELLTSLKKEDRPLMAGVLALVMILVVLEALLANRYRPSVRAAYVETAQQPATPSRAAA